MGKNPHLKVPSAQPEYNYLYFCVSFKINSNSDNYLHFFWTSLKGDGQTKVTCVKKHFLQVGNRILLINGLNDTRVETKIVSVISEKAFKLSDDVKLDCDAYYVVKLLSRNDQDSYVSNGICTKYVRKINHICTMYLFIHYILAGI